MLSALTWAQELPPGSLSSPVQRKDPTQFVEERPPVSRGELYSAPKIRYCLAESIRIEAVREVLDKSEPGSVEEFNAKIADFNGRCASYRFYESEMFFVKGEVDDHRARLQADARNEYLQRAAARKAERAKPKPAPPAALAEAAQDAAQPSPAAPAPRAEPRPEPAPPAVAEQPAADAQPAAPATKAPPTGEAPPPAPAARESAAAPPAPVTPPPPLEQPVARASPPASTAVAPRAAPAAPPPPAAEAPRAQEPAPAAPPVPGQASQPPGASKPAPQPSAPPPVEEPAPAPPAEAPGPAEVAAPEQPEPSPEPTRQRSARAKAPTPADDPVMGRYVREIQKMGARALDDRQVPEAARAKGWSGTAQIEVRFAEGGYIRSIVLAQSSGRAEFDTHALAIARGIMFPHVPKELASRDFSARFAIAYKARKPR